MLRDIKAGNILIDSKAHIYIADLGVCQCITEIQKDLEKKKLAGTPCWMAPEVISDHNYTSQSDVWSLGITAMELFKGVPPLAGFDSEEVLQYIVNGSAPSLDSYSDAFPTFPSSSFTSWLGGVLKKDPGERFTIDKVLNHRWFNQAEEGKGELQELLRSIPDKQVQEDWELEEVKYVTERE